MSRGARITIAGAGALGLACALALADEGCRVTVCDPADPLANASGVAAGMLAPVFEAVLDSEAAPHFDLLMTARNLWPALEARAGLKVDRSGALAAGREDWLAGVAQGLTQLGLHAAELPAGAARAMAPGLSQDLGAYLLNREDWRLDAPAALVQLRAAAQAAGVEFRREAVRGHVDADLLVVATGPSSDLAEHAPELSALSPIKGHILRVPTPGLSAVTVRGEGIYATPSDEGLVVGATMEAGLSDPAPDPARAGPLKAAGARLFPGIAEAAAVLSAGVRATTPDGLPLVGPSAAPGVILAAGARRNGWLLAPLVARTVAAQVMDRDLPAYAARLSAGRFTSRG